MCLDEHPHAKHITVKRRYLVYFETTSSDPMIYLGPLDWVIIERGCGVKRLLWVFPLPGDSDTGEGQKAEPQTSSGYCVDLCDPLVAD